MQPYNINGKTHGINGYGLPPPDYVQTIILAAAGAKQFTIPGSLPLGAIGSQGSSPIPSTTLANNVKGKNRYIARFSYSTEAPADVWVAANATAAPPSGAGSFAVGVSELNPTAWEVKKGDTLSFYTPTIAATISVALWHITD